MSHNITEGKQNNGGVNTSPVSTPPLPPAPQLSKAELDIRDKILDALSKMDSILTRANRIMDAFEDGDKNDPKLLEKVMKDNEDI